MKKIEKPGFRKIVAPINQEVREVSFEKRPQNLDELLELYKCTIKPSEASALLSTLIRYSVPAIKGPKPKSSRASTEEIQAALSFLGKKPILLLNELEEQQEKYFDSLKLPPDKRYLPRSILKNMIDWAREKGFLIPTARRKEIAIYRHTRVPNTPTRKGKTGNSRQLGSKNEDFVKSDSWKPLTLKEAKNWRQRFVTLIKPLVYCFPILIAVAWIEIVDISPSLFLANPTLDGELIKFIKFLQQEMQQSTETTDRDIKTILRILEWLKHQESKLNLNQLSLTSIIPNLPTPNFIKISQFKNNQHPGDALWLARSIAEEDMNKAIRATKNKISNYLDSLNVTFATQVNYLKSVVNLAKFIYFEQTKDFKIEQGYRDIDLIVELRKIQSVKEKQSLTSGQKAEAKNHRRSKMVPWSKILLAVEMAFIKFEQEYKYGVNTKCRYKNGSPRTSQAKRPRSARIHDFQVALTLAMATALPPARSKVYYQMEIGRTLIKGMLIDGVLVSLDNLPEEKKALATWWICLSSLDGKKDTIGEEEWKAEIPNRKFLTGKTLYWYLEEWINNWRSDLNPKHNCLYSTKKGEKLTSATYGHRVSNAFRRFTGSPVNPHLLRHILITYAYEQGMTDEERRSLAKCQQHSEETQAGIYNEQEMLNSLQPALKLTQRFAEEISRSFNFNEVGLTLNIQQPNNDIQALILELIAQLTPEQRKQIKLFL